MFIIQVILHKNLLFTYFYQYSYSIGQTYTLTLGRVTSFEILQYNGKLIRKLVEIVIVKSLMHP